MVATPRGSRSTEDEVWALVSISSHSESLVALSTGDVGLWEGLERRGPGCEVVCHFTLPGLCYSDPSGYPGCRKLSDPSGELRTLSLKSQV